MAPAVEPRKYGEEDEALARHFEAFGLNGYEARGLVALVRLGSGTAEQISRLSGITRTNVYRVLHELHVRGLATPLHGKSTQWAVADPDEVLTQLHSLQAQRLRELEGRIPEARQMMSTMAQHEGRIVLPHMRLLRSAAEADRTYARLLTEVRSELLMLTRSPFVNPGTPNSAVIDACHRGVRMRVLYQAPDLLHAEAGPFLSELRSYHEAGVEGRVVPELPIKLTVFDRSAVLVAIPDPPLPASSYPTMTLVEHPGYAAALIKAFEGYWAEGVPYQAWWESQLDEHSEIGRKRRERQVRNA